MTADDITEEQLDLAIEYVARHGAENRGTPVTYSPVFEAAGLVAPQELHHGGEGHLVTLFMEAFHHRCSDRGLPPLDALVVNVTGDRGGMPGPGYFRINGLPDPLKSSTSAEAASNATQHWEAQKDECRRWGDGHRRSRRRSQSSI